MHTPEVIVSVNEAKRLLPIQIVPADADLDFSLFQPVKATILPPPDIFIPLHCLWLSSNYGATWDAQQWENTRQWIGTTSSCNNSKRAAIVQHGNIWVQEGSDWKEMTASAKDWQAITYSCDGTRLVAIGK